MLTVLPHADELSTGHLGRWSQYNGFENPRKCLTAMHLEHSASDAGIGSTPAIHILAKAAGIETCTYERLHSLLPFTYFATKNQVRTDSKRWSLAIVSKNGLGTPRRGAYFCSACVREDVGFWGYSYWRRTHQLPSAFWCSKHPTEKLHAVLTGRPFDQMPERWLESGHSHPHSLPNNLRSHATLLHFEDACQLMLDAGGSRSIKGVRRALAIQAKAMGVTTTHLAIRCGPRLSDLAKEKMPRCLQEAVFPTLPGKVFGAYISEIDGAVWRENTGYFPIATALAISLLFPSMSEAFQKLDEAEASLPEASLDKTIAERYLQEEGDMAAVASKLKISISKVEYVIRSNRISIYKSIDKNAEGRALEAFHSGSANSIQEACTLHGASPKLVERAIWLQLVRKAYVRTNAVHGTRPPLAAECM